MTGLGGGERRRPMRLNEPSPHRRAAVQRVPFGTMRDAYKPLGAVENALRWTASRSSEPRVGGSSPSARAERPCPARGLFLHFKPSSAAEQAANHPRGHQARGRVSESIQLATGRQIPATGGLKAARWIVRSELEELAGGLRSPPMDFTPSFSGDSTMHSAVLHVALTVFCVSLLWLAYRERRSSPEVRGGR